MSYVDHEYRVRRHADIKLTVAGSDVIQYYLDAMRTGARIDVCTGRASMKAYVRHVLLRTEETHNIQPTAEVTVSPTGAPDYFERKPFLLDSALTQEAIKRMRASIGQAVRAYARSASEIQYAGSSPFCPGDEIVRGKSSMMLGTYAGETTLKEYKMNEHVKIPEKFPRFYVGSKSVMPAGSNAQWAKGTLKEAIAHATTLCEQTGQDQFVVQVVRVVRRKTPPVVVETVK